MAIAATSLMRPKIFGRKATGLDRFHCSYSPACSRSTFRKKSIYLFLQCRDFPLDFITFRQWFRNIKPPAKAIPIFHSSNSSFEILQCERRICSKTKWLDHHPSPNWRLIFAWALLRRREPPEHNMLKQLYGNYIPGIHNTSNVTRCDITLLSLQMIMSYQLKRCYLSKG